MALLDYHDTALNGNTTIAYSNFRDVKARNLTAKELSLVGILKRLRHGSDGKSNYRLFEF